MDDSPFLQVPRSEWVAANRSAFAIRDGYPVTPGHTLVVPRRLIATWWEASPPERVDMLDLVDEVKAGLDQSHQPDGYNVGFNAGAAAGQTVQHFHLHVIPRTTGDVADPRGGVRHVIPAKGNYLPVPPAPTLSPPGEAELDSAIELVDGLEQELLPLLRAAIANAAFDRIEIVVSFVRRSGINLVLPDLHDALDRGAHLRLLTTDYLGITEPAALEQLYDTALDRPDQVALRVFRDPASSFHPKAYIFSSSTNSQKARSFVGSSNLTRSGLSGGIEWNIGFDAVAATRASFEALWADPRSESLDRQLLDLIESTPPPPSVTMTSTGRAETVPAEPEALPDAADDVEEVRPHDVQEEALLELAATREGGQQAGLVVMATGLGKTYLAAFDVAATTTGRVLFVAHRDEILRQARNSFRQVLPDASMGMFIGGERELGARVLFASVQSLARHLDEFDADEFDYVIVDEFHHAAARSYRIVIDHFDPDFLLGLTATPERLDGASILALCNDNEVFSCDLVEGIRRDLLATFTYHGLTDPTDYAEIPWRRGQFDPEALENAFATQQRAKAIYNGWSDHGGQRTLAFCISQKHADYMAGWFRQQGVRAVAVHSGPTSAPRNASVRALGDGDIDVLFAVDLFNEGLDLPSIDTILMIRPTESPVVFMQQLGRGLRKDDGKAGVTVIDLIGNHKSFLLRPRVLLTLALGRTPATNEVLEAMRTGAFDLPVGCKVDFDLEVVDLLTELTRRAASKRDLLADFIRTHIDEQGFRPTKAQVLHAGLNPSRAATRSPWFDLLERLDALDTSEETTVRETRGILTDFESMLVSATRSYKMVTLRALLAAGALRTGLSLEDVAGRAKQLMVGDPRLLADVTSPTFPDPSAASQDQWLSLWRKNPVTALTGGFSGGTALFRVESGMLRPTFQIPVEHGEAFDVLVAELVEYRLARYLRDQPGPTTNRSARYTLAVSHAGGKPIVRYDRNAAPELPEGSGVAFEAGGKRYRGDFRKIALNVARLEGNDEGNDLHALLRGWFGPNAGHPGTSHRVVAEQRGDYWTLRPATAPLTSVALPLLPKLGQVDVDPSDLPSMDVFGTDFDPDSDAVVFADTDDSRGRWERADLLHVRRSNTDQEVVRPLLPAEFNPVEQQVGQWFHRHAVPGLFNEEFNPGNWNTGHVTLDEDTVLFVTLKGGEYDNRLLSPSRLYWYSQNSTELTSKKGREILEATTTGRRIHAFLRPGKGDFAYVGLVTPVDHQSERPIEFTYKLHTPLSPDLQRALRVS